MRTCRWCAVQTDVRRIANHSRWCESNPNRQRYVNALKSARAKNTTSWNKGLTKLTHPSIFAASLKQVNRKMPAEVRDKIRQTLLGSRKVKFKDTSIELKVEALLKQHGILYEKQKALEGISRVDFYLPETKTVIQCDGCFYHGCPLHHPTRSQERKARDEEKDRILSEKGYTIKRFYQCQIDADGFNIGV